MNTQIDLRGASGACYRFRLDNPARPANAAGGVFVFVREDEGALDVIYAGETDSLARADFGRWGEAVDRYGAVHLFTRLHVCSGRRGQELEDLVGALKPVMNGGSEAEPRTFAEDAA
jgi:hypothetical protein